MQTEWNMKQKTKFFLFLFPRCRLSSPRSGKVVQTEWNMKQKTKFFCFYSRVKNWATHKMKPRITSGQAFGLEVTTTPPPPPPAPPFDGGEQFVLRRGTYPPPVPLPTSGGGSTAPYPVARTLRYPRPIKGSRGDSLRNRVAIVYAGFARHSAESLLKPPEQFC